MNKHLIGAALAGALMLSACATNRTRNTTNTFTPKTGSATILVTPDVNLQLLMASGMRETRADWSEQGQDNLMAALEKELAARGSKVTVLDPSKGLTPRQIQLLKLNDAVVNTSLQYEYFSFGLPTKKGKFDRTIGPGAKVLAGGSAEDYALITRAAGSFSSGGKIAMNIAMAALGGPVQFGGTQMYLTLIDLDTGDIVWSNLASAATGGDIRSPEGAESVVRAALKDFPL